MNKNDKLNAIMIQLAVIGEKIDTLNEKVAKIEEVEERVEVLEKFRDYTKGMGVVSLAGLTTIVGIVMMYVEKIFR